MIIRVNMKEKREMKTNDGIWRFKINWEFVSPILRVASGTVHLEKIRAKLDDYKILEHHEWLVKITDGSLSYTGRIPDVITDDMKVKLDIMVHCYFSGVLLNPQTYSWID